MAASSSAARQQKNGDYAFLLHVLKSLKSTGKAAVILPHGVLFRGNAEAAIRRQLLQRGYIKGIIGLPPNLFYGTGIPACIVVLDKENAQARTGVFMIDASKGFMKDGPKNRLRSQDIHKIVDVFNKQTEIERLLAHGAAERDREPMPTTTTSTSRATSTPPSPRTSRTYTRTCTAASPIATSMHWAATGTPSRAARRAVQAQPARLQRPRRRRRPRCSRPSSTPPSSRSSQPTSAGQVGEWFAAHRRALASITGRHSTGRPHRDARRRPARSVQNRRRSLDEYDVYEQLMSYWHETMHDDVFLIMNEGWVGAARPRPAIEDKDRKLSETPDLVIGSGRKATKYKTDLIPPALIVARYFADEQAKLEELNARAEEATQAVEEYIEEHVVEEDLLWAAADGGKVTKALATSRLKQVKREDTDTDEITALEHVIVLFNAESSIKKAAKEARAALDTATLKKYGDLSDADVKILVLDDKWEATVLSRVEHVLTSLTLELVARVQELGQRYEETLEEVRTELANLEFQVNVHLTYMDAQLSKQDMDASTQAEVKQDMVQQILTGEIRLPGFTREWESRRLADLLSYEQPGPFLVRTSTQLENGRVPVLTAGKTFLLGYTNETDGVYHAHPVIIFDDFTTATQFVDFDFKAKSSAMKILSSRPGTNLRFIYERMQLIRFQLGDHKRYWISEYSRQTIKVPEPGEQDAIAEVLQTFTDEIRTLRLRLAKANAIKQGMMQELLSGRTRLPIKEE